jgi:hypothetical protein
MRSIRMNKPNVLAMSLTNTVAAPTDRIDDNTCIWTNSRNFPRQARERKHQETVGSASRCYSGAIWFVAVISNNHLRISPEPSAGINRKRWAPLPVAIPARSGSRPLFQTITYESHPSHRPESTGNGSSRQEEPIVLPGQCPRNRILIEANARTHGHEPPDDALGKLRKSPLLRKGERFCRLHSGGRSHLDGSVYSNLLENK